MDRRTQRAIAHARSVAGTAIEAAVHAPQTTDAGIYLDYGNGMRARAGVLLHWNHDGPPTFVVLGEGENEASALEGMARHATRDVAAWRRAIAQHEPEPGTTRARADDAPQEVEAHAWFAQALRKERVPVVTRLAVAAAPRLDDPDMRTEARIGTVRTIERIPARNDVGR